MLRPTLLVLFVLVLATSCGGGRGPDVGTSLGALEARLASIPNDGSLAHALERARILRALGRQDQALTELDAASEAARERLDWGALFALGREIGTVHLERGRAQDALEIFGKGLKTAASLEEKVAQARALVDTGLALAMMGSFTRADEAVSQAELLAGRELAADPLTAERVGLTRELLANEDRAAEMFAVAERGYAALGDAAGVARVAVYAAQIAVRKGGGAAALEAVEPKVARSPDPEPRARLLRYEAEADLGAARFERCAARSREAVAIADKRGIQPVAKLARVVLAKCAARTGALDEAIRAAEEAALLVEDQLAGLTGDQARQEVGFEAFRIYRMLLSLQVRLPEARRAAAAFRTMERARARSHLDAVTRRAAARLGGVGEASALLERKEEAEAAVRALTQQLIAHRGDRSLAERHGKALYALEDVKEAMAHHNPLLARIQLPRPPSLAEVRQTLLSGESKGALLVAYFVAQDEVVAIAIDATSERLVVLPSSPEVLERAVRAFRRDVLLDTKKTPEQVKAAARKLYDDVLGPFDAEVSAHERLVIVPHGELARLPFEALADRSGKFVVETHEVSYGLSATLAVELAKQEQRTAPRKAFVGVGDPVYDWAAFQAGKPEGAAPVASRALELWVEASRPDAEDGKQTAPAGLERLPGTAAELRAIAKLFGADAKLYLRDQATEETIKSGALQGHRIVHIASHGLMDPHYQALALTLNPASREDGFLLHSEIAELSLDADLVVLSACQTGNTRLKSSEPIAGLALALRSAGARRVVVSLWSVDDAATAKLMTKFYEPLVKEGAGYGKSLANAKRALLAGGPSHPFYWAPFVLLGS